MDLLVYSIVGAIFGAIFGAITGAFGKRGGNFLKTKSIYFLELKK